MREEIEGKKKEELRIQRGGGGGGKKKAKSNKEMMRCKRESVCRCMRFSSQIPAAVFIKVTEF